MQVYIVSGNERERPFLRRLFLDFFLDGQGLLSFCFVGKTLAWIWGRIIPVGRTIRDELDVPSALNRAKRGGVLWPGNALRLGSSSTFCLGPCWRTRSRLKPRIHCSFRSSSWFWTCLDCALTCRFYVSNRRLRIDSAAQRSARKLPRQRNGVERVSPIGRDMHKKQCSAHDPSNRLLGPSSFFLACFALGHVPAAV
jgi:hypothetical protein